MFHKIGDTNRFLVEIEYLFYFSFPFLSLTTSRNSSAIMNIEYKKC